MADFPIFPFKNGQEQQPLGCKVQHYIKNTFWPQSKSSITEYGPYFKYVEWAISVSTWPEDIFDRDSFAVKTYSDLSRIVSCMRLNSDCDRASILEKLRDEFPRLSDDKISRSMDLTLRLWLCIYVRSKDLRVGASLANMTEIEWQDSTSLKRLAQDCFPVYSGLVPSQGGNIDPAFTVQNLQKLCRIKVHWTGNLLDHLSYDSSTKTLRLFPHKVFLISHWESCEVLPKAFISETIQTLDLLFPIGEEDTSKYLKQEGQTFYRTSFRNQIRATDFGEFRYWGKRLEKLHDVFNQQPKTVLQMWYDRRNPLQWWTFWLAALIVLLTFTFGIISSYTGFRQMVIAERAYRLSIWQACSQPNPPAEFCNT